MKLRLKSYFMAALVLPCAVGFCNAQANSTVDDTNTRFRTLSLYPESLFSFGKTPDRNMAQIQLQGTWLHVGKTQNCLTQIPHYPWLAGAIQAGIDCAFENGIGHSFGYRIIPEFGFRKLNSGRWLLRTATLLQFSQNFALWSPTTNSEEDFLGESQSSLPESKGPGSLTFFSAISYKLAPLEKTGADINYSTPRYSLYFAQKWNDILESNINLGLVYLTNPKVTDGKTTQPWAIRLQYLESLPLALRKLGSLRHSALLQIKFLEISARTTVANWIFGGGIGYTVVTIDALRIGTPLPLISVGRQM